MFTYKMSSVLISSVLGLSVLMIWGVWMPGLVLGMALELFFFFFSSRRRHTRLQGDWSSDVCSSDLARHGGRRAALRPVRRPARPVRARAAVRRLVPRDPQPVRPRDPCHHRPPRRDRKSVV